MKLIIDIPEYVIDDMKECGFIPEEDNEELCKAIDNGTPIPNNATNGDVLDKLFPNLTYGTNREHYHVWSNDGKCTMNIHRDFWNAPYQKGGKE